MIDGPALSAAIGSPADAWRDPDTGIIYVLQQTGSIRQIKDGVVSTHLLFSGTGRAITGDGEFLYFILGNNIHRSRKSTPDSFELVAGIGTSGNNNGPGATASFNSPNDLIVHPAGHLLVADTNNAVVRRTDGPAASPVVSDFVLPGFVNGVGAAARYNLITDLELDPTGNVFVVDSGNRVIRRIDSAANATTYAGTGVSGYVDPGPTSSQFVAPGFMSMDSYGYLYVMDANRIRRVAPNREVRTVVRLAPIQEGTGNTAGINNGSDLAVAPDGTVFFGDTGTMRMVERIVLRN